jgi:hypothetical protein
MKSSCGQSDGAALGRAAKGLSPMRLLAFIVLIGFAAAGCARTMPVDNVSAEPVVTKSGQVSDAQVHDAILGALNDKGWVVKQDDPGKILAGIFVNDRHKATVNIDYSPTTYSITYNDSERLLYDGTNIHRNYNNWIMLLQQEINMRLSQI